MDVAQDLRWTVGKDRVRREGGSIVVRPPDAKVLSRVVKLAAKKRLPVGTAWNAPVRVDLSDMNKVLVWDMDACSVTVEAGVPCSRLFEFLYERNFLASIPIATVPVGEWAETGTPGFGAFGLGGPATAVRGVQALTLDGDFLDTGPSRAASGPFDLKGLFLGGRRALGIVAAVTLQLRPRGAVKSLSYAFADGAALGKALAALARSVAVSPVHVGFTPGPPALHAVLATDPDLLPVEEAELDKVLAAAAGAPPAKAQASLAEAGLQKPLAQSAAQWPKVPVHPLQTPLRGRLATVAEVAAGPSVAGLLVDRTRAFVADGEMPARDGFLRIAKLLKEHFDPPRIYGAY
ncbi:MAG: FAD-binding protein [Halobacteria archaeon]